MAMAADLQETVLGSALWAPLPDLKKPTKAALEQAMKGPVIARGELIVHYQKQP